MINLPYRLQAALPVISLAGLEPDKFELHKKIYQNLKNNQKHHVKFLLRPLDHIYLKSSSTTDLSEVGKKFGSTKSLDKDSELSSFDGIIKTKWLESHLVHTPQVVAMFTELSWFDPSFNEKALEIASQVSILKQSVGVNQMKIALVVIQPEDSDKLYNLDPLQNSQKQAAEKLQFLAKTVEIPSINVAEIDFKKFDKTCESVHLGLVTMVGHLCKDKIRGLRQKVANLPSNKSNSILGSSKITYKENERAEKLKLAIKYNFKIGFYNEINCEIEDHSQNERACFKAYRAAYDLLFDSSLLPKNDMENSQILTQTRLEILAVARLINCRLISFILIQDLDMKAAVMEFQKHLNMIKAIFHITSEVADENNHLKMVKNIIYHDYLATEKENFSNILLKNWERSIQEDKNKRPPAISTPGEYHLMAAKHLLLIKQNLENFVFSEDSKSSPPDLNKIKNYQNHRENPHSTIWLTLDPNISRFSSFDYLDYLATERLPNLTSEIQNLLKVAKDFYEKFNQFFSRKFLIILLEIAKVNIISIDQFNLLMNWGGSWRIQDRAEKEPKRTEKSRKRAENSNMQKK